MKRSHLVAAVVCLGAALPAAAQFRKLPEDAIKHRQSVMTLQGHYVGPLFAMANGRIPFDAKLAADNAEILSTLTRLAWVGFVEGTDKGETNAKPEIWKEKARFDESRLQRVQAVVNELVVSFGLAAPRWTSEGEKPSWAHPRTIEPSRSPSWPSRTGFSSCWQRSRARSKSQA